MSQVVIRAGTELSAPELYELLRLRCEVFVVEQRCAYQDLDGADLSAGTTQLWIADDNLRVVSSLRVLPGPESRRIGRVCTAAAERGRGHAARLMAAALELHPGAAWMLHAQCAVEGFYRNFGFAPSGPEFDEDGIPHVLMIR